MAARRRASKPRSRTRPRMRSRRLHLRHHAARRRAGRGHFLLGGRQAQHRASDSTSSACTTSRAAGRARTRRTSSSSGASGRLPLKQAQVAAFGSTRRAGVDVRVGQPGRAAAGRGDADRHHRRQELGPARASRAGDHARRKPGDDRRHRALSEGAGPAGVLRRGALLRRLSRPTAAYALACVAAAQEAGADVVVLCDTNGGAMPWEVERSSARRRAPIWRHDRAQAEIGIHTHDDAGVARGECAGRSAGGRDAGAGHDQRHRRAGRQLQPLHRDPQSAAQAGRCAAWTTSNWRRLTRTVALRVGDREPGAQPAAALRGRERVRAQGRHPRGRGDEGRAQLPAHRPGAGRQRTPGAGERAVGPRQPGLQGAGVRRRREQGRGAAGAGAGQGAGEPRASTSRARRRRSR